MSGRTPHTLAVFLALGATAVACASLAGDRGTDPGGGGTGDDGGSGINPGDIHITPDAIDVGDVPCTTEKQADTTIRIENAGPIAAPWEIQIPDGAPLHTQGPKNGTVEPTSNYDIVLVAKTLDVGKSTADVTVKVGPVAKQIPVSANGTGPKLAIVPSTADFGDVRAQTGGTVDVELQNVGTTSLALTRFDGATSALTMTWNGGTGPILVTKGQSATAKVTLAPGMAGTAAMATFKPVVDGATCGTLPMLPASARLVATDVTVSVADFGTQFCSSSPAVTKDLVITNYSSTAIMATAMLQPASVFTIPGQNPVSVAAASGGTPSTGVITLKLNTVGAVTGTLTEPVTVSISPPPPDGPTRMTTARVDVHGAILTVTPNPLTGFLSHCTVSCDSDTKPFVVTNAGNDSVSVNYAATRVAGGSYSWAITINGTFSPGDHQALMTFQPTALCSDCEIKVDFVQPFGTVLCAPPPTMDFLGSTN